MALNAEIIKSNEGLKDLTDDQIAAIETLSTNDEAVVIGKRIGKLHEQYDKDIFEITGEEKASETEKSYEYNKRVLSGYKEKLEKSKGLTDEISTLKNQVKSYEEKIKNGNTDEVLTQNLKDAQTKISNLTEELKSSKNTIVENEKKHLSQIQEMKLGSSFASVKGNLKFKKEYQNISDKLFKTAKADILDQYKADFVEENGKKQLVFRDADGEILRTRENAMAPTTLDELINKELKDVLDVTQAQGGGTKKKQEETPGSDMVDLSNAKTQVEADEIIVNYLMKKGITRGSREFGQMQKDIRSKNKIENLPVR